MRRTRRLDWLILGAVLITSTLTLKGDSLDAWLLREIERDEQELRWALRGTNGASVELLPSASRWSEPLFLEQPSLVEGEDVGGKYLADLDDYFAEERKSGDPAGGYLYRIAFDNRTALYSLLLRVREHGLVRPLNGRSKLLPARSGPEAKGLTSRMQRSC